VTDDPSWLVALLKPLDVAPHPNFFSSETVTGAGLCALLVSGRRQDFLRLVDPRAAERDRVQPWVAGREEDAAFVRAVDSALQFGSVRDGAAALTGLLGAGQLLDRFQVAAAGIIAASAFSELDDCDAALEVLELSLASARGWRSGAELAAAALYLQRGLRRSDAGAGDGSEDAAQALTLLQEVRPAAMETFQLSLGVGWDSIATLRLVQKALEEAAMSALMHSPFEDDAEVVEESAFSWQQRVRSAPSQLSLLNNRTLAPAFQ